jgi:hypothetical protein
MTVVLPILVSKRNVAFHFEARLMNRLYCLLPTLCALWLLCIGLAAPAQAAEVEPISPPMRVGQLALIQGTGRMLVDPTSGWEIAELNMPLGAGTSVAADPASRMEVRIGSTALRLAQAGQITFTELDDKSVNAEFSSGLLVLRVRESPAGERVSVSAGGMRLTALVPGTYRVGYISANGRVAVHVLEGQAKLSVNQQDIVLNGNQRAVVDTRRARLLEQDSSDERKPFDDFSQGRDRRTERSNALRVLPSEMGGAESLDGHGNWRNDKGYGPVWFPNNLPADWAPYRFGRWRWLAPWGWTWLDDAPWGFAPFHYGRWLFLEGRWAWVPSSATAASLSVRPVYAPALVGFYGDAGGASWKPTADAPAAVGWYPLAPGETYWPGYPASIAYVQALNAANGGDSSQIRAWPDASAPGPAHRFARTAFAATAVSMATFQGMQPVTSNQLVLLPAALAQAPLTSRRSPPALATAPVVGTAAKEPTASASRPAAARPNKAPRPAPQSPNHPP